MNQKNEIVLGIDGSNIRHGGGITHLSQLLQHAHPQESGIIKVVVWSNEKTLSQLPNKSWLKKKTSKILEGNIFQRTYSSKDTHVIKKGFQIYETPIKWKANCLNLIF